jgi:hypothetical protein
MTEIILTILFFIKLHFILNYFKRHYRDKFEELNKIYNFICETNPLILDLVDIEDKNTDLQEKTNKNDITHKKEVKYEDKYIETFTSFSNEYVFNEEELEHEKNDYEKIKTRTEKLLHERKETELKLAALVSKIEKIKQIQNDGNVEDVDDNNNQLSNEVFVEYFKNNGINEFLTLFELNTGYGSYIDDIEFTELYDDLICKEIRLKEKYNELKDIDYSEDKFRILARENTINAKLDNYINNYIMEHTPLGNVYMRYNNNKKSFEYFSNKTIPYRYLETIGRKYVITYWCKPLFFDMNSELITATEKYKEDQLKKEEEFKKKENEPAKKTKNVLAQLKNYNTNRNDNKMMEMNKKTNQLPPQKQIKMPQKNNGDEDKVVKENANRYTWEGRLSDFCPLKKINKKKLDKKLNMSYAEFKKMSK